VTLIVDGLRRRHFVVMVDRPMFVGRAPEEPDGIAVGEWLHEAASRWISRTHLKLEIRDDRLVATDVSKNGTLVWVRSEPGDRPDTFRLTRGRSYPLGEWDSVEMYTGIELCRADRRPRGVDESHDEPSSVLTDAPTFAMRQLPANG
jgi:predicted component of type VI protein secretion system